MAPRNDRRRTRRIRKLLEHAYGPPPRNRRQDALDVLVATVLSQSTNAANSSAGFENLKARFPTWDAAADAPTAEIARCIRVSGLARRKAPRIKAILRQVRSQTGRVSLEFLRRRPAQEAYDYLLGFAGVGPKTALCVLLFAWGKPVFPVDTHVHRIAGRLGLLAPGTAAERAHEVLTPMIAPADRYAMHLLLIAHGRATCRARGPRCGDCCLRRVCRWKSGLASS